MTEKDDEPDTPSAAVRHLARDAMFTVTRIEQRIDATDPEERDSFREGLMLRFIALESHFSAGDWPPLLGRVFVSAEDETCWGEVPAEWEACWALEGRDPRAETFTPGQHLIERGLDFIRRRVEPLSEDYWLISEAEMIRMVLDAGNADDALYAAFELGALREKARQHGLHLDDITKARRQVAHARSAGAAGAKETQGRAAEWQIVARRLAADKWARMPQRSISAVADEVRRELRKRGLQTTRNTFPSKETVRRAIGDLKPDKVQNAGKGR
ncbi:hypothetical protein LNKW23_48710 [Paralimibaculum aggregatum]|uniref:Uncharacterized protein n=1 Tax=Paralimibaculum aggregatum TaxID=3036245 RepID=A0ABQ6LU79_9RHOB|nr:hypothetical protein [Limibaculum sp. NKW23]GMG85646.1 hypothetical protein LNKW23_48710 [Limibaculum sp. NKW23]